jgi:hypothetical protein
MSRLIFFLLSISFGFFAISTLSFFPLTNLGETIALLLRRPDLYLFGAVSFGISFIMLGNTVKRVIEFILFLFIKEGNKDSLSLFLFLLAIPFFYIMLNKSIVVTSALLLFTLFYGILSVDTLNSKKETTQMKSRGN